MIDINDYKRRIEAIINAGTLTDIIDRVNIGSPYLNNIPRANDKELFITTRGSVIDDISFVGVIKGSLRPAALEHTLRIQLIYIVNNSDGQTAEIEADDAIERIIETIEEHPRLDLNGTDYMANISYPESVEALEFGESKTARVCTYKIIVNNT